MDGVEAHRGANSHIATRSYIFGRTFSTYLNYSGIFNTLLFDVSHTLVKNMRGLRLYPAKSHHSRVIGMLAEGMRLMEQRQERTTHGSAEMLSGPGYIVYVCV